MRSRVRITPIHFLFWFLEDTCRLQHRKELNSRRSCFRIGRSERQSDTVASGMGNCINTIFVKIYPGAKQFESYT